MYIQGITCYLNRFCGSHRDADIPRPSHCDALDDGDQGSPCPEDGDFFYARSGVAETEEAINKFMSGLESQELAGFDRLHSLLGILRPPYLYLMVILPL